METETGALRVPGITDRNRLLTVPLLALGALLLVALSAAALLGRRVSEQDVDLAALNAQVISLTSERDGARAGEARSATELALNRQTMEGWSTAARVLGEELVSVIDGAVEYQVANRALSGTRDRWDRIYLDALQARDRGNFAAATSAAKQLEQILPIIEAQKTELDGADRKLRQAIQGARDQVSQLT